MKMDLIFSDCWYRNLEHISQSAAQRNVTQESFPCEREAFTQLSQVNENQAVFENESDFIAFWNKNCLNYREQCETKQTSNSEHNSRERSGFNDLDEILNHVPCLPSNLKNIKGKEMNFVMIATSLDTRTMVENLENILDKTEFQALPLSFNNQDSVEPHINTKKQNVQFWEDKQSATRLKRKHSEDEEQRPTFQNEKEIVYQSKSTKRSRMSWMTTKKTNFDEEDKDLERQIKMLIQAKQLCEIEN